MVEARAALFRKDARVLRDRGDHAAADVADEVSSALEVTAGMLAALPADVPEPSERERALVHQAIDDLGFGPAEEDIHREERLALVFTAVDATHPRAPVAPPSEPRWWYAHADGITWSVDRDSLIAWRDGDRRRFGPGADCYEAEDGDVFSADHYLPAEVPEPSERERAIATLGLKYGADGWKPLTADHKPGVIDPVGSILLEVDATHPRAPVAPPSELHAKLPADWKPDPAARIVASPSEPASMREWTERLLRIYGAGDVARAQRLAAALIEAGPPPSEPPPSRAAAMRLLRDGFCLGHEYAQDARNERTTMVQMLNEAQRDDFPAIVDRVLGEPSAVERAKDAVCEAAERWEYIVGLPSGKSAEALFAALDALRAARAAERGGR